MVSTKLVLVIWQAHQIVSFESSGCMQSGACLTVLHSGGGESEFADALSYRWVDFELGLFFGSVQTQIQRWFLHLTGRFSLFRGVPRHSASYSSAIMRLLKSYCLETF